MFIFTDYKCSVRNPTAHPSLHIIYILLKQLILGLEIKCVHIDLCVLQNLFSEIAERLGSVFRFLEMGEESSEEEGLEMGELVGKQGDASVKF